MLNYSKLFVNAGRKNLQLNNIFEMAENSQLYILFVDLPNAFDGVPREDLWRLLQHHLGVPVHIISMLKSIYSGMQTRVCDPCGALSPPFDMGTGVRQGSVEGLFLFLLYFAFVIKVWKQRCIQRLGHEPGVSWVSTEDGSLREPARIRAASTRSHLFNNSVFADDTAIWTDNWDDFQVMSEVLASTLRDLGSELNAGKTEWMEVPSITPRIDRAPLPGCRLLRILGSPIAKCAEFCYLGSLVGCDKTCGTAADVQRRCALGHAAFGKLRHVRRSSETSRSTKARLLMACVSTVLLYGSESWTPDFDPGLDPQVAQCLDVFCTPCSAAALSACSRPTFGQQCSTSTTWCSQPSHYVASTRLQVAWTCCSYVSSSYPSCSALYTGPFSQQLNLVLSLITILVVLVCGCKASLVIVQLYGHALRRTSWRGNIRSTHAKLKLLADMVLLFAAMDNQQWLQ